MAIVGILQFVWGQLEGEYLLVDIRVWPAGVHLHLLVLNNLQNLNKTTQIKELQIALYQKTSFNLRFALLRAPGSAL